jgi:hypothetical protein
VIGAPLAFFGWWTMLGLIGVGLAAAALAERLAGPRAAAAAALLAVALPVVVRGAFRGDSNVPYAALAVGAAAAGAATFPASAMLAAAGLLRPEAWGLAAVSTVVGWRDADGRERLGAIAATLVPPAVWLGFDRISTGRADWSSHVVDVYVARFHPPQIHLAGLASAVGGRVDDVVGWPLLVLALLALLAGLRRRPLDAAVAFPVALAAALVVEVVQGQVSRSDLGRMLTALAVFGAVGAAVLLSRLRPRWALPAGVLVCLAGSAWWLWQSVDGVIDQGRAAGALASRIAPAAAQGAGAHGLVATERDWQAALALYGRLPRQRVVPRETVGRETAPRRVRVVVLERRAAAAPPWIGSDPPGLRDGTWSLYRRAAR